MKRKILIVIGTRPEAIKMAPVYEHIKSDHSELDIRVIATGQHAQLLHDGLSGFNMEIDVNLNISNSSNNLVSHFSNLLLGISDVTEEMNPDLVLVHGDTTTAACAAIAASLGKIPVGHVEAGLRSHRLDSPFPEEGNRRLIDSISTLFFAPTSHAADQINRDKDSLVYVTGNTVIDALKNTYLKLFRDQDLLESYHKKYKNYGQNFILVTQHRRESFGESHRNILKAIKNLASEKHHVIFPVHPNPSIRNQVKEILAGSPFVHLVDPVPYPEFIYLMSQANLAISDSGGIQEEAPSLGLPLLITREVTERPEALEVSTNHLVGSDIDAIESLGRQILHSDRNSIQGVFKPSIFGDGTAGKIIAQKCADFLKLY